MNLLGLKYFRIIAMLLFWRIPCGFARCLTNYMVSSKMLNCVTHCRARCKSASFISYQDCIIGIVGDGLALTLVILELCDKSYCVALFLSEILFSDS